jgi:16S rRNA (adenine1518-N6/adenine1519-N6)-dimethyltransferase
MSLQKRFGQNFLISRPHLMKVVEAASPDENDTVLEVGPGAGALTVELASRAKRVVAIELDRFLLPLLEESLAEFSNVEVIQADALKRDLSVYGATKVVANIPYNITSPLLIAFLRCQPTFHSITLMVQKEVATRLLAAPGTSDYGSLTVFVNYYASVSLASDVPRGAFMPPPKVDSAVIHLVPHAEPPVEVPSADALFAVSRAAFGQRRKTVVNALSHGLGRAREAVDLALRQAGVDPQRRGETVSLLEFAAIARGLFDKEMPSEIEWPIDRP